jgi:hypothetical protein
VVEHGLLLFIMRLSASSIFVHRIQWIFVKIRWAIAYAGVYTFGEFTTDLPEGTS